MSLSSSLSFKNKLLKILEENKEEENKELFVQRLFHNIEENENSEKNNVATTTESYLSNKNLDIVFDEMSFAIKKTNVSQEQKQKNIQKLVNYRFVDKICDIHVGKYIRWIHKNNPEKILNGGNVLKIVFSDNGCYVLVKNNMGNVLQYKFDECLSFHKLTEGEQLILISNEFANAIPVDLTHPS